MIPTKYKFIIIEFKKDYHTSIASKLFSPYDWWLNNKVKICSLQYNFLRPSPYDLRTEENDANFSPCQIKIAHHITYQKFLQYKEPENYLFSNSKYTSPFTFNSDYIIDHTKIRGKLRNYDALKQSFLFLPKRPIIVPQELLILNDDSLLQEDISQCISAEHLPPIQLIASQPLGDCEKSDYHAIAKKDIPIINYLSLFLILSQSSQKEKSKNTKRQIKNLQRNQFIPQSQSFPPTEEIQK